MWHKDNPSLVVSTSRPRKCFNSPRSFIWKRTERLVVVYQIFVSLSWVVIFDIRLNVSSQSIPQVCGKPQATNDALYLLIEPSRRTFKVYPFARNGLCILRLGYQLPSLISNQSLHFFLHGLLPLLLLSRFFIGAWFHNARSFY